MEVGLYQRSKMKYEMKVKFTADRLLTDEEVDRLVDAVAAQVEEPSGLDGDKRASFAVSNFDCAVVCTARIVRKFGDGTKFLGDA
jgi:hypothetical protein